MILLLFFGFVTLFHFLHKHVSFLMWFSLMFGSFDGILTPLVLLYSNGTTANITKCSDSHRLCCFYVFGALNTVDKWSPWQHNCYRLEAEFIVLWFFCLYIFRNVFYKDVVFYVLSS